MASRIPVGISACLLGEFVRYDGGHKRSRYCTDGLARTFDLRPQCPEVGAGLGTPRPAMQLVQRGQARRLEEVQGHGEHSEALQAWTARTLPGLAGLRGFVLMQKSPSCGLWRVPVQGADGTVVQPEGRGLFAAQLTRHYPFMPVIEARELEHRPAREAFIQRVYLYDDWQLEVGTEPGIQALRAFHARHQHRLPDSGPDPAAVLASLSPERLHDGARRYLRVFLEALQPPE